jgi:hypothetical protein
MRTAIDAAMLAILRVMALFSKGAIAVTDLVIEGVPVNPIHCLDLLDASGWRLSLRGRAFQNGRNGRDPNVKGQFADSGSQRHRNIDRQGTDGLAAHSRRLLKRPGLQRLSPSSLFCVARQRF